MIKERTINVLTITLKRRWLLLCTVIFSLAAKAEILSECPKEDGKRAIYGAECGNISLAENRGDSSSKRIDIYTLRIPSIRDSKKPPIFFIAGGPGQASTSLATQYRHQFKDLLVDHDFVFVDQRGTGKSNALECDIDLFPHLDKTPDEVEKITIQATRACVEGTEADLSAYTTIDAVEDLEEIRRQLNYERIFLWGGSYGSRVVLEYLRSYPKALAGTIMDGLAPVSIALSGHTERDASAALDNILSHCEASPSCQKSFPRLRLRWLQALDALEVTPQRVTLTHPRSGKAHAVYVDHHVLSSWLRLALYSRELVPLVPLILEQSAAGNYSTLFSIIAMSQENIGEQLSEMMQAAVLCAEDYHVNREVDTHESNSKLIRLPSANHYAKLCALYPTGHVDEAYFSAQKRDVPTLLLSGKFDPATPPRWADLTAQSLTRKRHIIAPGGHHIISSLGCVTDIIEDFIDAPENLASIDTDCVEKIRSGDFFIDKAGPSLEAKP